MPRPTTPPPRLFVAQSFMNSTGNNREKDLRLYGVGGLLLLGMGILLVGLWYVQVATALVYVKDQETQSMRTVRIPAVRGSILDAQGRSLAQDRPTYVVNAYLEELRYYFREEWKNNKPEGKLTNEESTRLEIMVRHRVVKRFTDKLGLDQAMHISPEKMQHHFRDQRALPLPVIYDLSSTNIARFMENNWKVPANTLKILSAPQCTCSISTITENP